MIEERDEEVRVPGRRTCPRCRREMSIVERGGEKLDICGGCGGIWFDATELDELMGEGSPVELLINISDSLEGENLACPVCGSIMGTKEVLGVYVDFCTQCSGIWMDPGETEKVWAESERSKDPYGLGDDTIDPSRFWVRFRQKFSSFKDE